jgi:hypothetical protein
MIKIYKTWGRFSHGVLSSDIRLFDVKLHRPWFRAEMSLGFPF